ncbi:hypothetical protein M2267_001999 [Ensifer sp. KUDG1]|jgi:hypothetical protein|uniref:hypothetical protein n=1 Tax=Ensifer sp. KUDG1 TaxID=3373919 RepID=UPI003D2515F4
MHEDEESPTVARGLLRLSTLFVFMAVGGYVFWDTFSEAAALDRLKATAKNYRYTESCDSEGNFIVSASANCVDLNHYVFIDGPVMKAVRRNCTGKPAALLSFKKGKVARTEINSVQKMLQFHARYGTNSPCGANR